MRCLLCNLRIDWCRLFRKCTIWHIIAAVISVIIFFNEYLTYSLQSFTWSSLYLEASQSNSVVRLMFVADPQLQGIRDESQIFGFFTRWDADLYLSRTFQRAYNHIQPDVIIFLGDLLDEGSIAQDTNYRCYYKRFMDIFQTPPHVKHIYLAGDNDVGGEALDIKEDWKVNRFRKFFLKSKDTPVINHKFLDFFILDLDPFEKFSPDTMKTIEKMVSNSSAPYHILLNHMGLLDCDRSVFVPVIQQTKASIAFTAHTHSAKMRTCQDCREVIPILPNKEKPRPWSGSTIRTEDSSVHTLDLHSSVAIQEVTIPTASYRMGVPLMGYGSAIVDLAGHMKYTVLWCPSRYRQLFLYLFLALAVLFCLFMVLLRQLLTRISGLTWNGTSPFRG